MESSVPLRMVNKLVCLLALLCLILVPVTSADLISDRLANAKAFTTRGLDAAHIAAAFSDDVTDVNIISTIREVGSFEGRVLAREYSNLVVDMTAFLGYTPFHIRASWDDKTSKWLSTDLLQAEYMNNYTTKWNLATLDYDIKQDGFRSRAFFRYNPQSKVINNVYVVQDPATVKMLKETYAAVNNAYVCTNLIFPACNKTKPGGGNYLTDTGFSTVAECISFLNSLPPTKCPFDLRSNTPGCRQLHAFSSFALPEIHCAHVRPVSEMCVDSCSASCSNCDTNAKCVASFPNFDTPTYSCQCNPGYIGDGHTCTAKTCPYGQCEALYGSYDCVSNKCMCKETFTHNPLWTPNQGDTLCQCDLNDNTIIYNNSVPICVPKGRCISAQWECQGQNYNQVKCKAYGVNTYTLFKSCMCNYGFQGGWEYPCSCPVDRRVLWSNVLAGEGCFSATECTEHWHCNTPSGNTGTCVTPQGAQIGSCTYA